MSIEAVIILLAINLLAITLSSILNLVISVYNHRLLTRIIDVVEYLSVRQVK